MYVVCRRGNVLCTLFVGGVMCLMYVVCRRGMYVVCRRGNVLCTLFVGGVVSYVRCL